MARSFVQVDGLNATLRALNRLPKEASVELRDAAGKIAEKHAGALRAAASGFDDSRVRGVAPTIRKGRDRVPVVKLGGARQVPVSRPGKRPRAGDVLFGTEFGAYETGPNAWRFPPKRDSYWLFRSLKGRQRDVVREWGRAVDDVARKWGR